MATDRTTPPDAGAGEHRLAHLRVQTEALQAGLVRLLQDVVQEEARLAADALAAAAGGSDTAGDGVAQAEPELGTLDGLTRLPNRSTLRDRFTQAVASARRQQRHVALLFLDLDDFKQFNDDHGHLFGDQVLCWVAGRLRAAVREVDTVSRHGGDEFLILLTDLAQRGDAQTVADKLVATLGEPVTLDGHQLQVGVSIGVALYPDDGTDFNLLVAHADAAMYAAKRGRAGTASAVAELKQARLREANEQLVLATLTAQDLLAAADQARERQVALLAAVAEELRNPSAPIRIAAAMLGHDEQQAPLLPKVQRIVETQLTHMASLVSRLVEASQAQAAGLLLSQERVDMGPVIDAAISAHQPAMDERGQHFESMRPAGPLMLHGDPRRLEQIVSNLLDNAVKHTLDGGHISLQVVVDPAVPSMTLTVADDGIGITAEMLPIVFEPFVQDTHALGFNGLGLGIGLTVVRALVRAQGGDLVALSAGARRGSQFVVSLPLAKDDVTTADSQGGADGHPAV
jgi:diguanylate cyclase (GGDEF)-like protein